MATATQRKKDRTKVTAVKQQRVKHEDFTFGRQSYILLVTGLVLIALGFILMAGGGSDDPNVFSEGIFSFRRMTLAPILILAGYVIEIFAIMKRPSASKPEE